MSRTPATPVLSLEDVTKTYRRRTREARTVRDLVRQLGRRGAEEHRTAVSGLSLSVAPGEMVGLIGGNGAGKSTTLRIAAGLTRPTTGRVFRAPGSAAVLSLGDTFALDLTGRENAITAAILAGATTREANRMVDAIVEFAELEDAITEPVRTYSEGMKLRLAFGVIAQSRPSGLLLDEVMAVGDLSFQRRSAAWIEDAREGGCGLLVASHDLTYMAAKADRLIWLRDGAVKMDGSPDAVVEAYRRAILDETYRRTGGTLTARERIGTQEVRIEEVELVTGGAGNALPSGAALGVRFTVISEVADDAPTIAVVIRDAAGRTCCSVTTERSRVHLPEGRGTTSMELQLDRLDLVPGDYTVEVGAYRSDWSYVYDLHTDGFELFVQGESVPDGVLQPPHRWLPRETG